MTKNSDRRKPGIIVTLNTKLSDNQNLLLFVSLGITLLFSLLYFNVGINIGGDDSGYFLRAMRLWEKGEFPKFQGPFYPLILAPFYKLFEGDLLLIRALSIPMILGSVYFIFKTYRYSFPPLIFFLLMLTLAVNFYWLTYASLTYSEALFNLFQFGIIYYFYTKCICQKAQIKNLVILAILSVLIIKTRSTGAGLFLAIVVYFMLQKDLKILLQFSGLTLGFLVCWEIFTLLFVPQDNSGFISQITGLLQVNPYDKTQGLASIGLILERIVFNFNEYTSLHILQFLGLRSRDAYQANWIFTLLFLLVILALSILIKDRSKLGVFTAIYLFIALFIVFLTPKMWSQARFLQPIIPVFYIFFFSSISSMKKASSLFVSSKVRSLDEGNQAYMDRRTKKIQFFDSQGGGVLILIFAAVLFIFQAVQSVSFAKTNLEKIGAFREGDQYFGQTPDWQNYFKACEWVEENVDENKRIACRKPQIAAVISGQDRFFGIYRFPSFSASEIEEKLFDSKENFIAMEMERFHTFPVPEKITEALRRDYAGAILKRSVVSKYSLFNITDLEILSKIKEVNQQLDFILPMDELCLPTNLFSVAFADSLLQKLQEEEVKYLMLANLRVYTDELTNDILSAVHNYKQVIDIKYPGMMREVFNTGKESQEPAMVYEIHYENSSDIFENLVSSESVLDEHVVAAAENYELMCEWALENTREQGLVLCSGLGPVLDEASMQRLVSLRDFPMMTYEQFIPMYSGSNNYLILNPNQFNEEQLEVSLKEEMYNSFCGFVYVGNYIMRLHQLSSSEMLRRVLENEYILQFVVSPNMMRDMPENEKPRVRIVESGYVLSELMNKGVSYIVEDNLALDRDRNIPRELMYLVKRRYPNAFSLSKEIGKSEVDEVRVYKVNYEVLD